MPSLAGLRRPCATQKCICPASLRSRGEQAVALIVSFSAAINHALRFVNMHSGTMCKATQATLPHASRKPYDIHSILQRQKIRRKCHAGAAMGAGMIAATACRHADCSFQVSWIIASCASNSPPWGIVSAPPHPKYTLAFHAMCPPPPPSSGSADGHWPAGGGAAELRP